MSDALTGFFDALVVIVYMFAVIAILFGGIAIFSTSSIACVMFSLLRPKPGMLSWCKIDSFSKRFQRRNGGG